MKKSLVKALVILFAMFIAYAGVFTREASAGRIESGGYADFIFYNYENETSSFAGNHFVFDLHAALAEGVFLRTELEWAMQRLFPEGGRATDAAISYAHIDYPMFSWAFLRTGKFLVPFNIYNERLYRADAAKLASPPYINSLLRVNGISPMPVKAAGTGLQLRGNHDVSENLGVNWAAYVIDGLVEEAGKGAGGRLGISSPMGFELGFSGYSSDFNETDESLAMLGVDLNVRYDALNFIAEYIKAEVEDAVDGFYIQSCYSFDGGYELVLRFEELNSVERTTLGANWNFTDYLIIRLAYEWSDISDGFVTQLALTF